ncbi:MAG: hypothetical protein ACKO91_03025 [Acidimicrobiales bacterium]
MAAVNLRQRFGAQAAADHEVGTILAVGLAVAWVIVLGAIGSLDIVVTLDSMSNYGHVWWIADQLWGGQGIPWRMDVLGAGNALTYPYGMLPWTTAALLWPLLGEQSVSVWLALGGLLAVLATFYAAPELRRGWWAVAVLVNPALVMAPIAGQLPFLWAVTLLLVGIGRWRRGRHVSAVALVALAHVNHPAVLLPVTAVIVAAWFFWAPDRRRLLIAFATSVLPALPAAYLVIASPVFVDSSLRDKVVNFLGTVGMRGLVVAVPLCLVALRSTQHRRALLPVAACGLLAAANLVALGPLSTDTAWKSLRRAPETTTAQWIETAGFEPGRMYRYLRADDEKVGMYWLLKAGGRLDSEFFPESIVRRSWADTASYSAFLGKRGVERVVLFDSYQKRFGTNERALLEEMAARPCRPGEARVEVRERPAGFSVYDVGPACP